MAKKINPYIFFKSPILIRKYKSDAKKALKVLNLAETHIEEYNNQGIDIRKIFTPESGIEITDDGFVLTRREKLLRSLVVSTYKKEFGSNVLDSTITILNAKKEIVSSISFAYSRKGKTDGQIDSIEEKNYSECIAAKKLIRRFFGKNQK